MFSTLDEEEEEENLDDQDEQGNLKGFINDDDDEEEEEEEEASDSGDSEDDVGHKKRKRSKFWGGATVLTLALPSAASGVCVPWVSCTHLSVPTSVKGDCNSSLLSCQPLMTAWRTTISTSLKRTWALKSNG